MVGNNVIRRNSDGAGAPATNRLALLLPWLNGDVQDEPQVRMALVQFLMPYPGGDYLGTNYADAIQLARGPMPTRKLAHLRRTLLALFADSVAVRPGRTRPWPTRKWKLSLAFTVLSAARARPVAVNPWEKAPRLTADARREYYGPGAYKLSVGGPLRDVLLYAVMRTLTEPGAVALAQCPAPSPDHSGKCGRWLVAVGKRGRPATYCSDICRVRAFQQRRQKEK